MSDRPFGSRDLYAGSRFLAPLSEEALLEAGRAAGLREGATLLEIGAGNGCAAAFLAEEFHLYVRGVEADPALLALALATAERSPAVHRLRFLSPEAEGAALAGGPVDCVAALRAPPGDAVGLLRAGGCLILGRYLVPPDLRAGFPPSPPEPRGIALRREATPLEWERFLAPLEHAIRAYRTRLRGSSEPVPLALAVERQTSVFRQHAARVRYELVVGEP